MSDRIISEYNKRRYIDWKKIQNIVNLEIIKDEDKRIGRNTANNIKKALETQIDINIV